MQALSEYIITNIQHRTNIRQAINYDHPLTTLNAEITSDIYIYTQHNGGNTRTHFGITDTTHTYAEDNATTKNATKSYIQPYSQ